MAILESLQEEFGDKIVEKKYWHEAAGKEDKGWEERSQVDLST